MVARYIETVVTLTSGQAAGTSPVLAAETLPGVRNPVMIANPTGKPANLFLSAGKAMGAGQPLPAGGSLNFGGVLPAIDGDVYIVGLSTGDRVSIWTTSTATAGAYALNQTFSAPTTFYVPATAPFGLWKSAQPFNPDVAYWGMPAAGRSLPSEWELYCTPDKQSFNPFSYDNGDLLISVGTLVGTGTYYNSPWGAGSGTAGTNPYVASGSPYTLGSGMISSEKFFRQAYGTWKAHIALPALGGKGGGFLAFWLYDPNTGQEIDVFEWLSIRPNIIEHNTLINGSSTGSFISGNRTPDMSTIFAGWDPTVKHEYKVVWTPTYVAFSVDGHETYRVSNTALNQPMHLICNYALKYNWYGNADERTPPTDPLFASVVGSFMRIGDIQVANDNTITFSEGSWANLNQWYDPNDSTSVFAADTGVTPASIGGVVGRIVDKKSGLDLANSDNATRPTYVTDASGLKFIDFTAAGPTKLLRDDAAFNALYGGNDTLMTAIYLARMDSTLATAATILSMADATGASLLKYGVGTSGGAVYTRSGTTNTTHSSSLSTNQLVVVAQIFRYTNPFTWMEVWVNGYQVYNEVVTDQASLSIQNMVLGSGKSATATYNAGWGGAIGGLYVTNDNYLTNNAWLAMQKLRAAAGI